MDLMLPGRVGERLITRQELHAISDENMFKFEQELAKIAERDGLAVTIEEKWGRGYMVQWAPVNEPWPW